MYYFEQVLRSIGYKGVPIDDSVPFDASRGIVPNENGRVVGSPGECINQVYNLRWWH